MQSSFQSLSVDGRLRPSGYGGLRDCVCEQRRQHPGQRDLNEQLQSSFVGELRAEGCRRAPHQLTLYVGLILFSTPSLSLLPKKIITKILSVWLQSSFVRSSVLKCRNLFYTFPESLAAPLNGIAAPVRARSCRRRRRRRRGDRRLPPPHLCPKPAGRRRACCYCSVR